MREERIRDLDERLSMEGDRMHVLNRELKAFNPFSTTTVGAPTTNQNSNVVSGLPTTRPSNKQRKLSTSPHR